MPRLGLRLGLGAPLGGARPSWAAAGSIFGLDFANQRYWPGGLAAQTTFSRASVGYADDLTSVWASFLSGVARVNNKGLRYEPARTNSIRNNSMQGAAAGTPGTLPTNWSIVNAGTLSSQVVGTGTENGVDYIDLRMFGTTSTTFTTLRMESDTQIVAAQNDNWTSSVFTKLAAGSLANVSGVQVSVQSLTAAGAFISNSLATATPTAPLTRYFKTYQLPDATTGRVNENLVFSFSSGVAIDITIRIGWPQLELGASVTSPIRTTTVAVARAADLLSLVRTDVGRIVFTFDDASQQTVSGITLGSPYSVPTTLNRQVIARMDGYTS